MTDSIEECLHRLNLDPSEIQKHRSQGDLVRQGFSRLATKCDIRTDGRADSDVALAKSFSLDPVIFKKALSLNPAHFQKDFLTRLESSLLPLLRSLLESFSLQLDPSRLMDQPGPELKWILELQSLLEVTLEQIKFMLYIICPKKVTFILKQTDDQHDEEVKIFRLSGLDSQLMVMFNDFRCIFQTSSELIWQLGLSTETCDQPDDMPDTQNRLFQNISKSEDSIYWTFRWLEGSELELVIQDWPNQFSEIDAFLHKMALGANPWIDVEQDEQSSDEDRWIATNQPSSDLNSQIARSLIPVLKLMRLFYKKSYAWAMNQEVYLFTTMSSDQLESIAQSASYCITVLIDFNLFFDPDPNEFSSVSYTETLKTIQSNLDTVVPLIVLHFVPTEFLPHDNFKEWLVDWYTAFNLAIFNSIKNVDSLATNLPQ
ncbi:hypothetical protein Pst134EB_006000 [Puccinia striiformis f. sp. tritici]|nr:hypothetical protein Pst134EB_006000 [Puccinia striiformis f. sp. tritici]